MNVGNKQIFYTYLIRLYDKTCMEKEKKYFNVNLIIFNGRVGNDFQNSHYKLLVFSFIVHNFAYSLIKSI